MTGLLAHNVGAEEERKREEEERGTRRREWAEKEKALARKWEELEGGMSAKEKGMMALFREEIGMLRERLAEAEGRPKPGKRTQPQAARALPVACCLSSDARARLHARRGQGRERTQEEAQGAGDEHAGSLLLPCCLCAAPCAALTTGPRLSELRGTRTASASWKR
eukprot:989867-Rhodomonas_salina.2